jgi:Tfp pilus assembly protein PilF
LEIGKKYCNAWRIINHQSKIKSPKWAYKKKEFSIMNSKVKAIVALVVALAFSMASCTGGGKSFNSADDLKAYLDKQPVNGPDKPIKVSMTINDPMLMNVANVIKSAGKYVSLNITGKTLTAIPDYAFDECISLTSITLPNGVTSIGDEAFNECASLTSVTIPNGVTSIGKEAFHECTCLTSVAIPYSVTSFGYYAFYGCTSLTSVSFENHYDLHYSTFPGDLPDKHSAGDGGPGTYTRVAGSQVWTGVTAGPYQQNGREAVERSDYDKAIAEFTQAIKLVPNYANAYYMRAYAYIDKGDYDKAIADSNEAIRLNPNYALAYHERAFAYINKGNYDKAIADADKAIQLNPNNANTYRHRGYAYMMKGNFTQARADTNKALQLNPNYQGAKDLDAELKNKGY